MSTPWGKTDTRYLAGVFKGRRERSGPSLSVTAIPAIHPYLRANRFQGSRASTRKENSSRGSSQRLRVRLRHRLCPPRGTISASRFGNLDPIPFRMCGGGSLSPPRFGTAFACSLGSTDPRSTAVHVEPFSTSAFKVLI